MIKTIVVALGAVAALAGCETTPITQSREPVAIETALKRARFEMDCPSASGSVLSSQAIEPAIRGTRYRGPERAEFTIGVTGCGKRQTYVVICSEDNAGCFAADGGRR